MRLKPQLRRYAAATVLLVVLAALAAAAAPAQPILLAQDQSPAGASAVNAPASSHSSNTILVKFRPGTSAAVQAAVHRSHAGTVVDELKQLGVEVVRVPGNAPDYAKAYGRDAAVAYAEPNAQAQAADVPNDPSFSLQWGLNKIRAADAWSVTHGSSSAVVAVLDTGVSLSHPDLASKIIASKNFSSSATVDDVNGHGTHVAGIAAAATNNGVGVAGVGYSAEIENVKVLGDDGTGSYAAIAQGITWAADNGANVINMSLVGTSASSTLESAVNYAWSKGVVVVAAAGNNANSTPTYPAYYTNAIAVAATTDLDQLAPFSDYGNWVDVAAPGISIYSTIPSGYGYKSGTSMASPYVAGLAAPLFSRLADTNGNGHVNDEVRSQIQATADNIGVSGIGSGRIDAYRAVTELGSTVPAATGTISGKVTDASTGAAIAGATISDGSATAVSDSIGLYTLANVAAGSYTVTAAAAGYTNSSQSVSLTSGQSATANLALNKVATAGAILGTVTDSATGAAITGATVTNGSTSATTDAAGSYTLAGVPAGSYTVTASAGGYLSASQAVSVTSGQTTPASLALAKATTVAPTMWVGGVTFKASGPNLRISASVTSTVGPVVGAQIQLSVACSNGPSWSFSGSTDSTGTASFAIQKAPKGTYTVTVTALSGPYPWDTSRSASSWAFTL
jgi:thermitase